VAELAVQPVAGSLSGDEPKSRSPLPLLLPRPDEATPDSRADPLTVGPAQLWTRVGELIDRAPNPWAIRTHKLQPLALGRLRQAGQSVPEWLLQEERAAALISMVTPMVLSRIRQSWDGPMLVIKGPAVAARYPNEARWYNDIDLLVSNAEAVHAALLKTGFMPVEDPDMVELDIDYHLQPLAWERFPLRVEIHSRPNWPLGLASPPVAQLFEQAVDDGSLGVEGVMVAAPAHQALMLAGHGWTERSFGCLRDLIDVAVMADGVPPPELAQLAQEWGMGRLWATTWAAVESVLYERRRPPAAVRLWARHLPAARERTVLETHVERWLSPFWALPAAKAVSKSMTAIVAEVVPLENETWGMKWRRVGQALRRALVPRSEHEWKLGDLAPPRRYGRFGIGFWRDREPPEK
jgi:Uncharacterised nucleotidyltransferase